jgi:hypothetical protein
MKNIVLFVLIALVAMPVMAKAQSPLKDDCGRYSPSLPPVYPEPSDSNLCPNLNGFYEATKVTDVISEPFEDIDHLFIVSSKPSGNSLRISWNYPFGHHEPTHHFKVDSVGKFHALNHPHAIAVYCDKSGMDFVQAAWNAQDGYVIKYRVRISKTDEADTFSFSECKWAGWGHKGILRKYRKE